MGMMGFHTSEYGCLGTLEIDGSPAFPLNCPAWDIVNLDVLWPGVEEEFIGENIQLPRIVGRRGYPLRLDQGDHNLIIWVRGDVDQDGVALTEPGWQGLFDNVATLRTNVLAPVATGDGTRACTLKAPNGTTTLTADCQFGSLRQAGEIEHFNEGIYTLPITIPAGRFS